MFFVRLMTGLLSKEKSFGMRASVQYSDSIKDILKDFNIYDPELKDIPEDEKKAEEYKEKMENIKKFDFDSMLWLIATKSVHIPHDVAKEAIDYAMSVFIERAKEVLPKFDSQYNIVNYLYTFFRGYLSNWATKYWRTLRHEKQSTHDTLSVEDMSDANKADGVEASVYEENFKQDLYDYLNKIYLNGIQDYARAPEDKTPTDLKNEFLGFVDLVLKGYKAGSVMQDLGISRNDYYRFKKYFKQYLTDFARLYQYEDFLSHIELV